MADELAGTGAGRTRRDVIRYVIGIGVGVLVLLLLAGKRAELAAAWHQLSHAAVGWLVAAAAAEAASFWAYARLQRRALQLSGTELAMPGLYALSLANEAIANSVPGEPVVSSAYRYRYYRRGGASSASAGWTIFTILIAQAIGLSLLLLLGVVVALAGSTSSVSAAVAVTGLVIVVAAGAVLVRRDLVLRLAAAVARAVLRLGSSRRRASIGTRIEATLARMREIPLTGRAAIEVVAIAAGVWWCDFLCLVCGFGAVHAAIPWHGVLLAYGVAQVLGTLPIVPGGLGIIEGSLALILAAYGAGRVPALSAALVYRLVSFWLSIAVGWAVVAALTRRARRRSRGHNGAGPLSAGVDLQEPRSAP